MGTSRVCLLAAFTTGAGLASGGGRGPERSVEERAELRVGEAARLFGGALVLRFADVREDSRCPREVACVWAGDAEILVEATAGDDRAELILHTHTERERGASFAGYFVRLEMLAPEPAPEGPIDREDYLATLAATRN